MSDTWEFGNELKMLKWGKLVDPSYSISIKSIHLSVVIRIHGCAQFHLILKVDILPLQKRRISKSATDAYPKMVGTCQKWKSRHRNFMTYLSTGLNACFVNGIGPSSINAWTSGRRTLLPCLHALYAEWFLITTAFMPTPEPWYKWNPRDVDAEIRDMFLWRLTYALYNQQWRLLRSKSALMVLSMPFNALLIFIMSWDIFRHQTLSKYHPTSYFYCIKIWPYYIKDDH